MDFSKITGINSSMLSGSKSGYHRSNPFAVVIFNARVVSRDKIVWKGDLDLSRDFTKLRKLEKHLSEFFVMYESDCFHFDTINKDKAILHYKDNSYLLKKELKIKNNRIIFVENHKKVEDDYFKIDFPYKKKGIELDIPLTKKPFSKTELKDYVFKFLLDNINMIKDNKISFYHKEIRSFAIEDYLSKIKLSQDVTIDIWNMSKRLSPKDFILYLYANKDNSDYLKMLKCCLKIDLSDLCVSDCLSRELFKNQKKMLLLINHIEIDKEEILLLKKIATINNLENCIKISSLCKSSSKKEWIQIRSIKKKDSIRKILDLAINEYFIFFKENDLREEFSTLFRLVYYFESVSNQIINFRTNSSSGSKFLLPTEESIMF